MIELKHNIAYAKFAHVDDLDLDYGRTVKLWQADTPIGKYQYWKQPDVIEDGEDPEECGKVLVWGPTYSDDFEQKLGVFNHAMDAQRAVHNDMVRRITECFKENEERA